LSCLVYKDNKDITTRATKQPSGHTCELARVRNDKAVEEVRSVAKSSLLVEMLVDVDCEMKKFEWRG
jgi:hypothetical protein